MTLKIFFFHKKRIFFSKKFGDSKNSRTFASAFRGYASVEHKRKSSLRDLHKTEKE